MNPPSADLKHTTDEHPASGAKPFLLHADDNANTLTIKIIYYNIINEDRKFNDPNVLLMSLVE
jgi:hypothetical protein